MNAPGRVVRVAVEAVADTPERTFSYRLPDDLGDVVPGSLLLVPYGRRLALGYLLPGNADPIGADPIGADLKVVEAVVSGPMLTPDLLTLAEEIAAYYRAPIGTTLAAMLPPGLESRLIRRWRVERPADLPVEVSGSVDAEGWISDAALARAARAASAPGGSSVCAALAPFARSGRCAPPR